MGPPRVEKSRPAKACNTCRRKKVKCDGKRPTCSTCVIFKLPCGFEDTEKRASRSRKTYVEELEQRVKHMDNELQHLRQSVDSPERTMQHHQSPARVEGHILSSAQSPVGEVSPAEQDLPNPPSYFLRGHDGKMRFFGVSSGLGVHDSGDANRPMTRKPNGGREYGARRSAFKWPLTNWIPRVLQGNFEHRTTQALPSREETFALVDDFLTNFNHIIPLVDDVSFGRLVERHYSWNPDDSPSSWILLNIVLAFSYRERANASSDPSAEWQKSLGHVRNAFNVLVDIFLRNADLASVQGLLGLALYFQGTPNAQAQYMLAASAMRLSHSIGLHRNVLSGFTPAEIEERRRTFWISFILDAEISLRVGRPPAQDMKDYNTPLPAQSPHDGRGIVSINGVSVSFFRLLAEFATIQRSVYRCIQSAAMSQQPKEMIMKSAEACEKALLSWRGSIPDSFHPDKIRPSEPNHFNHHFLRLHLAYHSCYANLSQLSILTSSLPIGDSQETSTEIGQGIRELCLRAIDSARSAVRLLPYVRSLGSNYRWNVIYFFSAACVALASEMRSRPGQLSEDDLTLIHAGTAFLKDVSADEPGTFIDFILDLCSDVENSSRRATQQARTENSRQLGQSANHDSADLNIDLSEREQLAGHGENNFLNSDADLLNDINLNYINPQWAFPPFWNWQDSMLGVPVSGPE